jgi:hypothetical protein
MTIVVVFRIDGSQLASPKLRNSTATRRRMNEGLLETPGRPKADRRLSPTSSRSEGRATTGHKAVPELYFTVPFGLWVCAPSGHGGPSGSMGDSAVRRRAVRAKRLKSVQLAGDSAEL